MSERGVLASLRGLERLIRACGDLESGECTCAGSCGCGGKCGGSCSDKKADSTDGYFGPQNTMNDYSYGGDFAFTRPDSYVDNPDYNRQVVTPSYGRDVASKRKK